MLDLFNELAPFMEDCYRKISVREYAKVVNISPPTASKVLSLYYNEGILKKEEDKQYIFYYANRESQQFIELSRLYWRVHFKDLIEYMQKTLVNPTLVLFGSLVKAEARKESDIDLAVIAHERKLDIARFEKKFKRPVQIFRFDTVAHIKPQELQDNIRKGYVLAGRLD